MSLDSATLWCPKEKLVSGCRSQLYILRRILIVVWRPSLKWGANMEPCLEGLERVDSVPQDTFQKTEPKRQHFKEWKVESVVWSLECSSHFHPEFERKKHPACLDFN